MKNTWRKTIWGLGGVACFALMSLGCDDDIEDDSTADGGRVDAGPRPPTQTDGGTKPPPAPDGGPTPPPARAGSAVHVEAKLSAANNGAGMSSVTVRTTGPGETVDIPAGAKATLKQPGGGPDVDLTPLLVRDSATQGHINAFPLTMTGVHHVVIEGANGAVTLNNTGTDASSVKFGELDFGFERLANGTLIVPSEATVTIPTKGTTLNEGATFNGLPAGARVEAQLRTHAGTTITKRGTVAAGASSVTIKDLAGGVKATDINGTGSRLAMTSTAPAL